MPNLLRQIRKELYVLFRLRSIVLIRSTVFLVIPIYIVFLFAFLELASAETKFRAVEIEKPFADILLQDPDFMYEGGARVFASDEKEMMLVGIAKVVVEKLSPNSMQKARRRGEILARTKILEFKEGIEVFTLRGMKEGISSDSKTGEKISLSSFLQVTETRVEGEIQQLPIVGTWWNSDRTTFYVAVGKIFNTDDQDIGTLQNAELRTEAQTKFDIEGEEPFRSILKNSPILCKNGGVRGYMLSDGEKVLISVDSAPVKDSLYKAKKVARIKAIRGLLGHSKNLQLSSVEYLTDREHLRIYEKGEELVLLSDFLSIQEEQVSGMIKALPIIATWEDSSGQIIYVAVGNVFDGEIE